MKKSSRVISTLLLGATLTSFSTGVFAVESKEVVQDKLAGATRYETNLAVSAKWDKADTVVLVNSYGIADALAATPLAKKEGAPILITEGNKLTTSTAKEIERLGAKKVIIVGGDGVVSNDVVKDLEAMKLSVERLGGKSRYETSAAVVKAMGKVDKVAVVNGYGLADALSVAAPAASNDMAIVLSEKDALNNSSDVVKNAKEKYVIGGEGVISESLAKEIGAERLGGATRGETNAEVLEKFYANEELDKIYVAKNGDPDESELVDALGAGALAGKENNPVVLAGAALSAGQEAYLKARTANAIVEVGHGINTNTVAAIVKALEVKDVEENVEAKILSAKSINGGQVEVKFNKEVDKDSAKTAANYTLKGSEDGNITVKADNIIVKEDNKTVVVTLDETVAKYTNQQNIDVKVENVLAADKKEKFPKYEETIKMTDTKVPTLEGIKQVGPRQFDLTFSEPVKKGSKFDVQIKQGSNIYTVVGSEYNYAENTVTIKTGVDLADGEYSLEIAEGTFVDFVGLKSDEITKTLTVKKDTSAVAMNEVTVSGDTATIKFNKKVENFTDANVKFYLDYVNESAQFKGTVTTVEGSTDKIDVKFNNLITPGNHKIIVRYADAEETKIEDLWGNKLAESEMAFEVENDTAAPTVSKVEYKNTNIIEVTFDKAVEGADKADAYELKNSKGEKIAISNVVYNTNDKKATLTVGKIEGNHTLVVKADKITDTTINKNKLAETSFEIAAPDKTAATVKKVVVGGKNTNEMTIEYSEAMKTSGTGSVLDKSLYEVQVTTTTRAAEWKNLNDIEDAKIESIGSNGSKVKITLPEENELDAATPVKIGQVQDLSGNKAEIGSTTTIEETVADAIVIEDEINVVGKNKVEIITEAKIKDVSKIKVEKGTLAGSDWTPSVEANDELKVANSDIATTEEGKTKLTLTFSKVDGKDNFTTNPAGNLKVIFANDAAETDLGTTKGVEKVTTIVDKVTPEYVKDSAKAIKNADEKLEKVEFTFTEELDAITRYSFEVEGFKVVSAAKVGEKVTLTLDVKDQEDPCHLDKVTVRQVGKIADMAENELKDFSAEAKVEAAVVAPEDTTAPTVAFTSSTGVTNVVLTVSEKINASNGDDLKDKFELSNTDATITSAIYDEAAKTITFTIEDGTSTAMANDDLLKIVANAEIKDEADNAIDTTSAINVAKYDATATKWVAAK